MQRASDILDSVKIEGIKKKPPKSECYQFVARTLNDRFLKAKLEFMISVADQMEPFLTMFQSDACLFPFLYEKLDSLIRNIGNRFLKKIVYQTNIKDESLLKAIRDVEIGFGASHAIKEGKIPAILEFKKECCVYLQACLLYTSPSPRDRTRSRMPSSA